MHHISIIIVHYNSDEITEECLKSLADIKSKGFSYNIVVVDNASREPFVLPKAISNKKFEVLRSESNLGFTGGNNLGIYTAIEKYNSDFILLLNNDTVVDSSFLFHLHDHLQNNDDAGLVCPKIYFYPRSEYHLSSYKREDLGKVIWYGGGSIDWQHLVAFHRGVDEIDRGQFDTQKTSDFATGCCVLIRREVLEKTGTLDKKYFLYLEDVDLSLKAIKRGYEIHFCPKSVVWHKNAGSSGGSGSYVHQYYQTRNRLLLAFRYGSARVHAIALKLALYYLRTGNEWERRAVKDLFSGRLGKQPLL